MEIGEVSDAQPVERRRNALEPDLEHALPKPAGFEPSPAGDGQTGDENRAYDQQEDHDARSFPVGYSAPQGSYHGRPSRSPSAGSDGELLGHGRNRDDVALELQLRGVDACRDPHQLREVQDRHLEVLAGLLAELGLPGVERQVAEGAGCDHCVRARLLRLLDRLDELGERDVLAGLDDRGNPST